MFQGWIKAYHSCRLKRIHRKAVEKQMVGVEELIDMAAEAHAKYLEYERKEKDAATVAYWKGRWEALKGLLND